MQIFYLYLEACDISRMILEVSDNFEKVLGAS